MRARIKSRTVRRVVRGGRAGVVSLASLVAFAMLVATGASAQAVPASASASHSTAASHPGVRTVPDRRVQPRAYRTGPGLPQVRRTPVTWPAPAQATVAVPSVGTAKIGAAPVRIGPPARGAAPAQVTVRTFGHEQAATLGGVGLGFTLAAAAATTPDPASSMTSSTTPTATPTATPSATPVATHSVSASPSLAAPAAQKTTATDTVTGKTAVASQDSVSVTLDASGFAGASGGDLVSRLGVVELPACVLTSPQAPACRTSTRLPSSVDAGTGVVTAQVPVATDAVFLLAAAAGGETGDFSATPLNAAQRWDVGKGAGGFAWSYAIPAVQVPGNSAPDLSLGYSSQAVDGQVAPSNNQPSWAGLGWDVEPPFIERDYQDCKDNGLGEQHDDCWDGDLLQLSMNGSSTVLVRDRSEPGDVWRGRNDTGLRVERLTGASNGDNDGEYWQMLSPDGARYTFGRGAQATTNRATNSVFTVPVFGNDAGEPCHAAPGWCQQAWRWNVDSVVDAHGNEESYFYTKETNSYALAGTTTTSYVRGGEVSDIEYGQRAGAEGTTAPARLHFTTSLRCTGIAGGGATTCPALTPTSTKTDYPDVPSTSICTANCAATLNSPTFFTGYLLSSVTAQRSVGTGANATWSDVDRVGFDYLYPKPTDGTDASLWLNAIHRTGLVGGSAAMPAVTFTGTELPNRVDHAGVPEMRKLRVGAVTDELGARTEVTYATPDPCDAQNLPAPDSNTKDCFPAWRANGNSVAFGWFYKYLVTQVKVLDQTGGSPAQTTAYRYGGQPAWHYDDVPATSRDKQSWGDWRGYGQVDAVQLSDPAFRGGTAHALSDVRDLYFRGMDGDRSFNDPFTGDGTRRFSVVDSAGTSVVDSPWLAGRQRESQQLDVAADGTVGAELGGAITSYGVARTTQVTPGTDDRKHDAHLVVPTRTATRQTVIADPGGARTTRSTTTDLTYDSYGQELTVTSTAAGSGAAGGGSDVRCSQISYARDAASVKAYLLAYPFRVRGYAGTCAAPSAMIDSADQYYDGSATLGAPITHGDRTRTVTATASGGPNTVTGTTSTSTGYDAYGRTTTSTDGNQHVTSTAYTPATGIPTTQTVANALGQTATTGLDPNRGLKLATRDANGQSTTYSYDPLGRLTSVRFPGQAAPAPAGYTFSYALDPNRVAPPATTTRQLLTGSIYLTSVADSDSLGRARQTQVVSPASTAGAPKTVLADTRYDDRGLVAARTQPLVVNSAVGSGLVAVSPTAGNETRSSYDALGRATSSDFYSAGTFRWRTTTAYFGDHVRSTPPAGGVVATSWTDVRGRSVRTDDGIGASLATTTYRYDDADRQVRSTDPAGHASTAAYDLAGRTVASTDPDAGASTATYDGAGNRLTTKDALGQTVSTDYDVLNRPVTRWKGASGSGERLNTWNYDSTSVSNGIGRLASEVTKDGLLTYTEGVTGYDARGRITGRAWTFPAGPGGSLIDQRFSTSYGYDEADHQTSVSYPDRLVNQDPETIRTGYSDVGLPTTLTGTRTPLIGSAVTVPYVSATGYAADGKLLSRTYANPDHQITRGYSYDTGTQRLSNISTTIADPLLGTTTAQDDTYSYDPSGNLTSIVDRAPPATPLIDSPTASCYTYDGLDRLAHAWTTKDTGCADGSDTLVHNGPSGFNESWTYSPDGNLTSARSLLVNRSFSYGDANHRHAVTQAGLDVFGYDADGQQNTRVKTAVPSVLTYTPTHQLSTVTEGVKTTKFVYDGEGNRLSRLNPDTTATLYIDGQEVSIVAGIAKGARYYKEAGTLVAERLITTALMWQLNDTQGSAQLAVLSGTNVATRTYYDPYGKVRDLSVPPVTDHGFLGAPQDPLTGLDGLGARNYDPDLGRFVSPDPISVQGSSQAANAYAYAANNPVGQSDPSGLCPVDVCGVGTPIGDGRVATNGPVDPGNAAAGYYHNGVFVPEPASTYTPPAPASSGGGEHHWLRNIAIGAGVVGVVVVGAAICVFGGCEALAAAAVVDVTVETGAALLSEVTAEAVAEGTAEVVAESAVEAAGEAGVDAAAESAASETAAAATESTSEAASSEAASAEAQAGSKVSETRSTLEKVANEHRDALVQNPDIGRSVLSEGEINATAERPFLERMSAGKVIERLTASDSRIQDVLDHVGGPNNPDFVDESGLGYELTTSNPSTIASHLSRAYVELERLATYEPLPAEFTFGF